MLAVSLIAVWFASVQATTYTAVKSGTWNNAAIWMPSGVPTTSSSVVVPENIVVTLTNTVLFKSLDISGTVTCPSFANTVQLTGQSITVSGGKFECGSAQSAFNGSLRMTMTGSAPLIAIQAQGSLQLFGRPRVSWTRLRTTVPKGSNKIVVFGTVDWVVGDEIVLAPTDFEFDAYEPFKIIKVEPLPNNLQRMTLNATTKWTHYGRWQTYGGKSLPSGEVGLLTRNIKIYGTPTEYAKGNGVSILIQNEGTKGTLRNVEIRYAGWFDEMGRYPVHWHAIGDGSGQSLISSSIYYSLNKCVVVHCTDNVLVAGNVCVDHMGHGFITEENSEINNKFRNNLGITTRRATGNLIPSESEGADLGVATFWTQNGNNEFTGNVAAGSMALGFSIAREMETMLRQKQNSACPSRFIRSSLEYGSQPLLKFENNVAHSISRNAFWFGVNYRSSSKPSYARGLKGYKISGDHVLPISRNQTACFWAMSSNIHITDVICSDFTRGFWSQGGIIVHDAVLVAFSENKGDADTERERIVSRSLPVKKIVTGVETYDQMNVYHDIQFYNFVNLADGSPSYAIMLSGGMGPATGHRFSNFTFFNPNTPTVSFGRNHYTGRCLDTDGSLTGVKNNYLLSPIIDENKNLLGEDVLLPGYRCAFAFGGGALNCTGSYDYASVTISYNNGDAYDRLKIGMKGTNRQRIKVFNDGKPRSQKIFGFPTIPGKTLNLELVDENSQSKPFTSVLFRILNGEENRRYNYVIANVKPGTIVKYSGTVAPESSAGDVFRSDPQANPVRWFYEERSRRLFISAWMKAGVAVSRTFYDKDLNEFKYYQIAMDIIST